MNRKIVDLRSDTVTKPTPQMYEAMKSAPLGDNVLDGDPTVKKLEKLAAEKVGKEAALFVPTGTMANQVAVASLIQPGDSILVGEENHLIHYEVGGPAIIANALTLTVPSENGTMDPDDLEKRILKYELHTPQSTLLCLENTHNRGGGTIIPQDYMAQYDKIAKKHDLKIHMDGARIFNAAVSQNIDVSEITQYVDTVSFCLSKGLGAPVGSMVCGSKEFINKAQRWAKRLGGGMRQSGVIAACGIVSLEHHIEKLAEDHRKASVFAESINQLPGLSVNLANVQTNIVMVDSELPAIKWVQALSNEGILFTAFGENRMRIVFHSDISEKGLQQAIGAFESGAKTIGA